MVEMNKSVEILESDDEIDPEFMIALKRFTSAAVAHLKDGNQNLLKHQTSLHGSKHGNDSKFSAIFDQELAHLQEMIYERGYNPDTETLPLASNEAQRKFGEEKQELLRKDAELDHASGIKLSYKGAVVSKKLDNLRNQMLEKDHSLVVGEYYDKLQALLDSPLYDAL